MAAIFGLISALKREPNWGHDTFKPIKQLLTKSPDPPSIHAVALLKWL